MNIKRLYVQYNEHYYFNMEKIEVAGYKRDNQTGALLSTDKKALLAHKKERARDKKVQELESRVRDLEEIVKILLGAAPK